MTSIDAGTEVIRAAREHLASEVNCNLSSRITYRSEPIEHHSIENAEKYDAVIVSEVLEHVVDKPVFLELCLKTLKV